MKTLRWRLVKSDTKIFKILWQKWTNSFSLVLPTKFYASTIKNKRIRKVQGPATF